MNFSLSKQHQAVLLLMVLLALLAGCGRKGPVRPKLAPLPAAPVNAVVEQQGDALLLSWTLPAANQDGSPLTDLQGFRLYRMTYDAEQACPECRDLSELHQLIDLDYLQAAVRIGERLFFRDTDVRPGVGYHYRIVPFNRAGREGAPFALRRPFFDPPVPPAAVTATGHDRLVRLAWEPVRTAGELLGYNVYRRTPDQPFPFGPLNREIVTAAGYEDYGPKNDQPYLYAVRSVLRIGELTVESGLSATVEAIPRSGL